MNQEPAWMEEFGELFGVVGTVPTFIAALQGTVLNLINKAIEEERAACAKIAREQNNYADCEFGCGGEIANDIEARGKGVAIA